MTTRRSFSREFKLEAVRLAQASGNTARTARDLDVRPDMIRRWKRRLEEDGTRAFPGHGHPRDEEMMRLRRELQRLKEENIVLKKAAGILSQGLR
jgi:transposase